MILDMSKIESGRFHIDESPFDLASMMDDLQRMLTVRADENEVELTVVQQSQEYYQLLGDQHRIGQVLVNLLSNAIKFSPRGKVKLTALVEHGQLVFRVEDNGIGISTEMMDRLFSRFEQADQTISTRFGGTGLGLFISNSLADLMGGSIDVSSREGEGSVFTFSIPYRQSDIAIGGGRSGIDSELTGLSRRLSGNVLIAEDTPALQLLIRRMLEGRGLTVSLASNGEEAIELHRQGHFDLILMDMQMPVLDGIEACKQIRQSDNGVPVVAMTANVMQKHRERFIEAGCDDFLAKPIDRQELERMLEKYIPAP